VNLSENADCLDQRLILDALPVLVFLERQGNIVFANAEARRMLGLADGAWNTRPVEEVLWGLFPGTAEPQTLLTGTRQGSPFHATVPAANGRLMAVEGTYCLLDPASREAVIVAHPGGRDRAPKTRLMDDVLASLPEAVAIEHGNHLLYTNPAFARMFGYDDEEASGSLRDLIVPQVRRSEDAMLLKAVDEKGGVAVETVRSTRSGELVAVGLHVAPLLVNGARVGYVYSFRNIGDHKEAEATQQHNAMHDILTGLPNRALFQDRLHLALMRRLRRPEVRCGVLCLDLDRFKDVNDALGHAAGDVLLKEVALRLTTVLRPQDSAARLGGDQFAVLVENIAAVSDLEVVAQRVLREVGLPFEIYGHTIQSKVSLGGALAGAAHNAPELLIRDAKLAMKRAKQAGGARLEVSDRHLEFTGGSQKERERELRDAIDTQQYEFRFQPVFQLREGWLDGFAISLWWQRRDGAMEDFRTTPDVAKDASLSDHVTWASLAAACEQLRMWAEVLPARRPYLTVNVMARQFYHPDFVAQLYRVVEGSGADPSRLVLELSESTLNESPEMAATILQRLAEMKLQVAMGQFGSSLGPLNHLLRLPLNMVKLDGMLIPRGASASKYRAVLEALLGIGQSVGIQMVIEGVSSEEQFLCDAQAGHLFGHSALHSEAVSAEEALRLAMERTRPEHAGM
jgi:diguanylate cyclase (GGDEF)-like protein/PAS domain S-box-containing protein